MNANVEQPLFVDTTILIRRRVSTYAEKERIDRNLGGRHRVSSTYVKAEYINVFLRAAVEMYNCVVEAFDLGEVPGLWNRHYGGLGKLGLEILWLFARQYHAKDDVLARFQTLIEDDIPLWFEFIIDEVTDATQCEAAGYLPKRGGGAYEWTLQFPPPSATEGLRQFLSSQMDSLQRLHANIASQSRYWRSVRGALAHLLAGDYDAVGVRGWQRLGDVIIALEAKVCDAPIYTTNLQHFQPICEAIGSQLPICEAIGSQLHQEIS